MSEGVSDTATATAAIESCTSWSALFQYKPLFLADR